MSSRSEGIGRCRDASTLRKHVKTWQRARTWLAATFNILWPQQAFQLAMHLEARAREPCGRSIPTSIYKTFVFLEHAGEVPRERQLQNEGALKNALEEINMKLQSVEPRPAKQAIHLLSRIDLKISSERRGPQPTHRATGSSFTSNSKSFRGTLSKFHLGQIRPKMLLSHPG